MSNTPAGWYDDGAGRQRWWDGARWTERYAPATSPAQAVAVQQHGVAPLDYRRARLTESISGSVRNGWRVEAQGEDYAVIVYGNRPNHILHLILTLVTAGLWGIVWICVAIGSGEKRMTLRVDPQGNVSMT